MDVFSYSGATGLNPITVGGTGTGQLIFPSLLPPNWNKSATTAAVVQVPGNGIYEGRQMVVRAGGNVTFGSTASPTFQFGLVSGTSLTYSSGNLVADFTAASVTISTTVPWSLIVALQGDSVSGQMQVVSQQLVLDGVAQSVSDDSGLPTGLATVSLIAGTTAFSLGAFVKFGVSHSDNLARLMQFTIEA